MPTDASKSPEKNGGHTPLDDAQGYLFGTAMCAFALVILRSLGLVTGQTAGLAVLISYLSGWAFGPVFFAVNLPFYWFAYKRMGTRFVGRTFINVALVSVFAELFPHLVAFDHINPLFGAVMVGLLTGAGLLAIFRHGGSLGGIGILALYLQDATGLKAGYVQLGFDAVLFAVAAFVLPLPLVAYSLAGAVVVNLVLAINHRRDRYIAT